MSFVEKQAQFRDLAEASGNAYSARKLVLQVDNVRNPFAEERR